MESNTSFKLTLEQRKLILQLMNYSYTIPDEFQPCVAEAIRKYATQNYSDEAISKMVTKSQNIANSGFLLREDSVALFRGKFAEWLACIEYNALKNSGSVIMTIVNPDESSKADLLHFIKVGDEFKAVAGPDIKSGGSTYVFNQWKKIVTSRHDIPMVDFDNILTTESGLKQLSKKQREEFEMLSAQYPKKKPIPTRWDKQAELRLRTDYFKELLNIEDNFQYTPEVSILLKEALKKQGQKKLPEADWSNFNKKCKEIFNSADFTSPVKNKNIEDSKAVEIDIINPNVGKITNPKKIIENAVKYGLITAAVTGVAYAGVVVAKNPEICKNFFEGIFNNRKNINPKSASSIKDFLKAPSQEIIRKPPIAHEVSGYIRRNGTKVAPYLRGKG